MALTNKVHVECGYSVVVGNSTIFHTVWSETIAVGATTTQKAGFDGAYGEKSDLPLIYRVNAPDDKAVYAAIGKEPAANVAESTSNDNARGYVKAADVRDFPAKAGEKLATSEVV